MLTGAEAGSSPALPPLKALPQPLPGQGRSRSSRLLSGEQGNAPVLEQQLKDGQERAWGQWENREENGQVVGEGR